MLWGYSEGGAAATWAAQLQPAYAPELRLLGTAAGGVPADVAAVARHLDGGAFFGFGVSALMGLDAAFPQLDLEQYLNAAGRELFTTHQNDCLVQLLLPPFTLNRYASITTQDVLARADVQAAFAVSKLGASAPQAPILLFHGLLDEVIPYERRHGAARPLLRARRASRVADLCVRRARRRLGLHRPRRAGLALGARRGPTGHGVRRRAAARKAARRRAAARQRRCPAKRPLAGRARARRSCASRRR